MSGDARAIFSLYRTFHRQIRLLPTVYLQQFFFLKLSDDFRSIMETKNLQMQAKKVKRVEKELWKLQLANTGNAGKFNHVLDLAYGRKGKLRWELMNPILPDPAAPLPDPIIPAVEKSRPPVFSPELTALLTSGLSHRSKALGTSAISHPPTLPARADPTSEEARLLGPFSKRREVNIRWRFYTDQVKRVYPPLQVVVEERGTSGEAHRHTDLTSLNRAGVREVGMQGEGIFEEAQALASSPARNNLPESGPPPDTLQTLHARFRPRFLRRRFAYLLGRIPILTYSYPQATEAENSGPRAGRYNISVSPVALHTNLRYSPNRLVDADTVDLAWLESAETEETRRKETVKRLRAERLKKMEAEAAAKSGE